MIAAGLLLFAVQAPLPMPGPPSSRPPREIEDSAAALRTAFAAATFRAQMARMRGLWFGPVPICRQRLVSASLDEAERIGVSVSVTFVPAMHHAIRSETEAQVGHPMGVYLDGRLLIAPMVYEPLNGAAQIHAVDRADAEAIRAAALRPC
jgi:hypothetical protein